MSLTENFYVYNIKYSFKDDNMTKAIDVYNEYSSKFISIHDCRYLETLYMNISKQIYNLFIRTSNAKYGDKYKKSSDFFIDNIISINLKMENGCIEDMIIEHEIDTKQIYDILNEFDVIFSNIMAKELYKSINILENLSYKDHIPKSIIKFTHYTGEDIDNILYYLDEFFPNNSFIHLSTFLDGSTYKKWYRYMSSNKPIDDTILKLTSEYKCDVILNMRDEVC